MIKKIIYPSYSGLQPEGAAKRIRWVDTETNRSFFSILCCFFILSGMFFFLTLKGLPGNPKSTEIKDILDQPGKPFELSPERGRYAMVMSFIETGNFAMTKTLADAVYPDVGYHNGKYYSYFTPGVSLIAAPFYLIGSAFQMAQVASFSISSIFALFNIYLIYIISKKIFGLPLWAALFGGIIFAFGSNAWSYSTTLYQHHITTFLIYSSIFLTFLMKKNGKWSWIMALYIWAAYGFGAFVDYPNIILMAPAIIYFVLTTFDIKDSEKKITLSIKPMILLTSIIFFFITVIHGVYNQTNFGSWRTLSGSLIGVKSIRENTNLLSPDRKSEINKLQQKKNPVNFFKEDSVPFGLYTLLFSTDRGLFFYSPVFLLSLWGLTLILKNKSPETIVLSTTVGMVLFLYSSWSDPWGGWGFGPRYLIPALPALSIFIVYGLVRVTHQLFAKIIAFALFLFSSAVSLAGALTTNAIPPMVEAIPLHTKYNYFKNIDDLFLDKSSSFIYNLFFSKTFSLFSYFFVIYISLSILAFLILFIFPKINKNDI
ncbi:MAG: hypothetical protein UT63_C0023G0007 [Candidatus Gottesmanbacteria bacterium GW2011_GWC2_39_8]|uniref:Glycosyltransferase RgtA/B/C/D-like domain-containing protein n=1 Tax=Candidatus Gottesmanbacteria bacterium GW2011_GWC2_39_8 TaxID=1618450 RepID=A0A0G0PYD3_9BACT|nr:MAG: hypothetical protein UT63_C0023G0007 [Candidatus Gottesmanbacteria bacterium GW2011_GWC2_39_8]